MKRRDARGGGKKKRCSLGFAKRQEQLQTQGSTLGGGWRKRSSGELGRENTKTVKVGGRGERGAALKSRNNFPWLNRWNGCAREPKERHERKKSQ